MFDRDPQQRLDELTEDDLSGDRLRGLEHRPDIQLLDGRANIAREDIEHVAVAALAHRIMLNYAALSDGIDAAHIVERVIKSVRAAKV